MQTIAATNARDLSTEPRTPEQHAACHAETSAFMAACYPAVAQIADYLAAQGGTVAVTIRSLGTGNHEVVFAPVQQS